MLNHFHINQNDFRVTIPWNRGRGREKTYLSGYVQKCRPALWLINHKVSGPITKGLAPLDFIDLTKDLLRAL